MHKGRDEKVGCDFEISIDIDIKTDSAFQMSSVVYTLVRTLNHVRVNVMRKNIDMIMNTLFYKIFYLHTCWNALS